MSGTPLTQEQLAEIESRVAVFKAKPLPQVPMSLNAKDSVEATALVLVQIPNLLATIRSQQIVIEGMRAVLEAAREYITWPKELVSEDYYREHRSQLYLEYLQALQALQGPPVDKEKEE